MILNIHYFFSFKIQLSGLFEKMKKLMQMKSINFFINEYIIVKEYVLQFIYLFFIFIDKMYINSLVFIST